MRARTQCIQIAYRIIRHKILKSFTYAAIYQSVLHHPWNNRLHHFDRNVPLKQIRTFYLFLFHPYFTFCVIYIYPRLYILSNICSHGLSMTYFILFFIRLAFSTKIPHYLCTFNILLIHYFATVFASILKILHFFNFIVFFPWIIITKKNRSALYINIIYRSICCCCR